MFHEIKQAPSLGERNLIEPRLFKPAVSRALSVQNAAGLPRGRGEGLGQKQLLGRKLGDIVPH